MENLSVTSATRNTWYSVLLGCLVALGLYVWGYAPRAAVSIQESDGAEFYLAALKGTLVHPPGYPLYTAMSYVWSRLFPCNVYHSLALFSSICQAAASGVLVVVLAMLGRSLILAFVLTISWALFEPSMRIATDVEVFAFHHLLSSLLLLVTLWASAKPDGERSSERATGVLLGMTAAHQQLVVLLLPLLLGIWLLTGSKSWRSVLRVVRDAALVALLLYLSLFVRYWHAPELAFAPLQSAVDFLGYLLRAGYGTFSLFLSDGEQVVSFAADFWKLTLSSLAGALVMVIALLLSGVSRRGSLWWGALGTVALTTLFVRGLCVPTAAADYAEWMQRFYATAALSFVLVAAAARPMLAARGREAAFAVLALCVWGLLNRLPEALDRADASHDHAVEDEVHETLMTAPKAALILVESDRLVFGLNFKQRAQALRPDVYVIAAGMLESDFYRRRVAQAWGASSNFDADTLREPAALATLAFSLNRPLLVEASIVPPPGVNSYRLGILNRWSDDPVADDTAQRLAVYTLCSRLPESLRETPPARQRSRQILKRAFLDPLAEYAEHAAPADRQDLDGILTRISRGEIEQARQLCSARIGT